MRFVFSKYLLAIGLAMAFAASHGQAQSAADPNKPELPKGPLLNPAPAFSKWQETFTYPQEAPSADGAPAVLPDSFYKNTRTVVTTKTKERIHEEIYDMKGRETERWFTGADQYTRPYGDKDWEKSMKGNYDPYAAPFPASGFRNVDMVTESNYAGDLDSGGKSYLVFAPGGPAKVPSDVLKNPKALALLTDLTIIDDETRLPFSVKAAGVTRVFQFVTPPSDIQSYPPDLLAVMAKEKSDDARLFRPIPRAY